MFQLLERRDQRTLGCSDYETKVGVLFKRPRGKSGLRGTVKIRLDQYPQLRQLCWNRAADATVCGEVALGLYENNWRFIEQDRLGDEEQALIDELITRFGNGVFLPR